MNRLRRLLRVLALGVAAVVVAWAAFVGLAWRAIAQGPEAIGTFMARVPGPLFMVMPMQTLWNLEREGTLRVGDPAPDFELATPDGAQRVRLSSFRGERPVVLIFGSYT
jgi:hypothetical protein